MREDLPTKAELEVEVAQWPLRHIAKRLGVPYSRLYNHVKALGIVIPKRQGYVFTEEARLNKSKASKAAYARKYPNGRFGKDHPHWQGGRRTASLGGYVRIYAPDHPRAVGGAVAEHQLVAEKTLGRFLNRDEVVHHINGKKDDNRPENLEVCLRSEHVKRHMTSGHGIQALTLRIAELEAEIDKLKH